jgi:hypothetical protein
VFELFSKAGEPSRRVYEVKEEALDKSAGLREAGLEMDFPTMKHR